MYRKLTENRSITHLFYIFIAIHLLCWTFVPLLVRYNLPLDAIEGTIWGQQLHWGYDKNPFLNGWLTAFAIYLGGPSGWMIYFFSQLSVIVCFWSIWQLGKKILPVTHALLAVMLLEGVQYYHLHAIDFNDNTLELGLWGLTIYFFYNALCSKKNTLAWILTGFFAGLGMMAKYYTAALLSAMVLFIFSRSENRKQFTYLSPYLGLLTFFIVILPHTLWLFFHDFITVKYVFARASSPPAIFNHVFYPSLFAWQQFEAFAPALLLFTVLWLGKKPLPALDKSLSFNKTFLLYLGLGPFVLTLLLSLLLGITLRAGWGMPLLSLWGLILFTYVPPHINLKKVYRCFALIIALMAALLIGYSLSLMHPAKSSANFPGQEIAAFITKTWHDRYQTKLTYVAGSRWVGGNIGFYSTDHPAIFIEWNEKHAPWIDTQDLTKKGAVFIWCISDRETMPPAIAAKFPALEKPIMLKFNWLRGQGKLPPIQIGMALLPPADIEIG